MAGDALRLPRRWQSRKRRLPVRAQPSGCHAVWGIRGSQFLNRITLAKASVHVNGRKGRKKDRCEDAREALGAGREKGKKGLDKKRFLR